MSYLCCHESEHKKQSQVPPEIVFFGDPRKPPPVEAARDVVRYFVHPCHMDCHVYWSDMSRGSVLK